MSFSSISLVENRVGPPERLEPVGTVSFFVFVYFSRGTLPPKKGKRALLGDLVLLVWTGVIPFTRET